MTQLAQVRDDQGMNTMNTPARRRQLARIAAIGRDNGLRAFVICDFVNVELADGSEVEVKTETAMRSLIEGAS